MFGFLFLVAFAVYWLFCVLPCMWAALRLNKRVGREPDFAKFAFYGCASSVIAMSLAVYTGPIIDGQADGPTLMFKHLFGLHTLLLLFVMFFSAVLRGATGRSGGYFFGVGLSSIVWFLLLSLQSLLPIKITH